MIDSAARRHRRLGHVATPFLIQAALKGSDAVAIAAEFNNPIYSLIAKPEIKTFADLKGKLLGMAAETGYDHDLDAQAAGDEGAGRRATTGRNSSTERRTALMPDARRLRGRAARASRTISSR